MANIRLGGGFLVFFVTISATQPSKEIDFVGLQRSNPGPTFDHGYVIAWDLVRVHSATLYSPAGERLFDLFSWRLPDGREAGLLTGDVDTDGVSAFVYRGEGGMHAGIALFNIGGKQTRMIEMSPYEPGQVCFAPDHSLWMFGEQRNVGDLPAGDFLTFRHYSRAGELLGSFVPRSALPKWEGTGLDQVVAPSIGLWRLRTAKDRIGAVLHVGPFKQAWVELDLDGKVIGQWSYATSREEGVFPIAFDATGSLYGRHWLRGKNVGISRFDKATSTWEAVPSLPNGRVLGAEGTRLVYQDGDKLRWVEGSQAEGN